MERTPITVPRLGWSMEEGTFVEWRKQDGEKVAVGDALFVLESDKAAEVIEAIDSGILRIPPDGPQPGDKVKVGQVLGYLVGQAFQPELHVATARHRPAISPRARRLARQLGIDWNGLQGSGRTGRIRERDVRTADAGQEGRLLPHTSLRRTVAGRMLAAVTQTAPVTLTTKAEATNLVNLRNQFQAVAASPEDIPTYTDLIVKLTAITLRQHEELQAQWREEGLFVPGRVDIAIAVDTDAGLFAPVIRAADRLTVRELAAQARELIALARAGRLSAEQMRDATFTVTNLGMFGVDVFTPLIHLPQSAILGVGKIAREPVVVNDAVVPRDVVTLSLTFDHRVIDGAPAARFLATLRDCIEQPAPRLMP